MQPIKKRKVLIEVNEIRVRFNYENFSFAKDLRGFTAVKIAEKIGTSTAEVSYWLNGKKAPRPEKIFTLSRILQVPVRFLTAADSLGANISNGTPLFRSSSVTTKKQQVSFEKLAVFYNEWIKQLGKFVQIPKFKFEDEIRKDSFFQILGNSFIKEKANFVRNAFNLADNPIANVTALLERSGVFVVFVNEEHTGINALTIRFDGRIIILINIASQSAARIRFSLAHELGHVFLHLGYDRRIYNTKEKHKVMEAEANEFASELLLPEEGLLLDLMGTGLKSLVTLKPHWGVSVQTLIMRLNALGIIDDNQKINLFRELSRKYSRKDEPFDHGNGAISIEYPSWCNAVLAFLRKEGLLAQVEWNGINLMFVQELFPLLDIIKDSDDSSSGSPFLRLLK
nr:XRE family transcriptional regulator [Furfurilactobacillus milii]